MRKLSISAKYYLPILAAMFMILVSTQIANATPTATLSLSDGTNSIVIVDQDPNDTSAIEGIVGFNGVLGNFDVSNITSGMTTPVLGSNSVPNMFLDSSNISSSNGGGTLTIMFSQIGFTYQGGGWAYSISPILIDTSLSYSSYYDLSNTIFDVNSSGLPSSLIGSIFLNTADEASGVSNNVPSSTPYSLTQILTITHTGAGVSNGDATLAPVPEPSTLLLFGLGLLGLGFVSRKKMNERD